MDLNSAKPKVGGGDHVRIEALIDILKLAPKKWITLRILPSSEKNAMIGIKTHWVNIIGGKTRKEVKIPKTCVAYNPADESEYDGVTCPYCELEQQTDVKYYLNVISRSEQENAPNKVKVTAAEKKSGYKDMDSESWTPIRVLRCPPSLLAKIQGLKDLNKVKTPKGMTTFGVDHAKFGRDISIKFDGDAKGGDKYQIQLSDKSPLTEEELSYLIYDINPDLVKQIGVETEKQAKAEIKKMEIVGSHDMDDGDDDDEDDDDLGSKKKPKGKAPAKPAAKGKRKPVDDDEDDEDDDDEDLDDDEDDEDDEPPARRKKPAAKAPAKGKRKPVDDDEDDDEDLDDEEDDDLDDDDEDLDDDEEEEDDEDDAPPARGKKPAAKGKAPAKPAAKGKSKSKFDDDEDLDDDEEDDEDDEPPVKSKGKPAAKGKTPAKAPAKGKRKPVDDDEDEDDEDLDDDEDDEDDEPPVKSKGKAPAKRRSNF